MIFVKMTNDTGFFNQNDEMLFEKTKINIFFLYKLW